MYNEERENRRLYVASYTDDIPNLADGDLIPKRTIYTAPDRSYTKTYVWYMRPALLVTFSALLFAVSAGTAGYSVFRGETSVAAPIVMVQGTPYEQEELSYGVALEFSSADFFVETWASLIEQHASFIEVDLVDMQLGYYEDGELTDSATIIAKGKQGSWWQVPAGLYTLDTKKERHYSTFGNVYLPWSLSFEGNFVIHGTPQYRDGETVPDGYEGGGIRLYDEDAERIFRAVDEDMTILVHERSFEADDFLYTPKVSGVKAPQYLIADLESNTVLAADGLDDVAPIASLAKLMTALVAAEDINLDRSVRIRGSTESFVATLIPRLESGYSASMYSLLQLLLLESSNEAAEVIASVLGRAEFIEHMNKKASSIGMEHTTFADTSGLHDGNVSTARDLLTLLQYINHHRGFILELTANQHLPTAYTNGQFGELANFNEIEETHFIAGKVGETLAAGQTSVSLHKVVIDGEDRTIAVILLGTDERKKDIRLLLEYVAENFGSNDT